MKSLTIRNIPDDVEKVIKNKAAQKNISLNKSAIEILKEATQKKTKKKRIYHDLDFLFGTWTKDEAKEFDKNLKLQRDIDKELWNG